MYILRPDEKSTPVMLYSNMSFIRGEAVTRQSVRVNIWLRTDGAPKHIHVLKPQTLVFGGSPAKMMSFEEIYFPVSELAAFHPLPPSDDPLDYDASEANRQMQDITVMAGTFLMKGQIRISTQTEMSQSLEVAHVSWMSLYDAEISNPFLPQMTPLHVPLVLVNPSHVAFAS
ncbi:MAG TPA: hypothetical protein PKK96_05570 [Anaerolineales bacterium]|nr:hypothetical protein [Anaerolineales bacterium]HNQ95036.1 hypothetical protein [Anaerolineales bacterium]HNS60454.1 hypothetical protein [Anaerolineales bacterium]